MKKVLAAAMAVVMCMAIAACGSSNNTPTTSPEGTQSAQPTETASVEPTASDEPTETPEVTDDAAGGSRLQAVKDAGKIVMVTSPDFAPYEFLDPSKSGDEQYVGLDIALGKYIAEELGVDLEIKSMDFDATLAAIGTSNCDMGISGYSPREDRMDVMDFSDIYYEGVQVVVIRKEDADKYKEVSDLEGKLVAAQNGSEQQSIVEEQLEGAELKLYTKVPEEVMALKSGQVEAVAMEGPNAEQVIAQNDDLMISEIAVEGSVAGTAVAVPKGSEDLLAEINNIIKKAKEEGKIEEWLEEAVKIRQSLSE